MQAGGDFFFFNKMRDFVFDVVQKFDSIFPDCPSLRCITQRRHDRVSTQAHLTLKLIAGPFLWQSIWGMHISFKKKRNKYRHYLKWRLCFVVSGESHVKTVIYRHVTWSLMSALCISRLSCPTYLNLAVTTEKKKEPKTIVLLLRRSVNLPQEQVPMACKV